MSVAFDHLMVMVADEAAAAQEFSQAGFTVTPRSELPGMANRLICFPSSASYAANFIELLPVERPGDVPPSIRRFIGSLLGPVAVVLAVPDLARCGDGCPRSASVLGPIEIRRRWTLPSDQTLDVALDILIGDDELIPFRWAVVAHHTVKHYKRTDFTLHPNGIMSMRAAAISVEEPGFVAERMVTLFGCAYRRRGTAAVITLECAAASSSG